MKLPKKTLSLAIGCAFASAVHAQSSSVPSVIITAHPIIEEVRLDNFSSTTAVVTADQLRDQNALDLASALRRTPGVQISRYNPVGAFGGDQGGAVFIRGMGVSRPGSEIKTYIDGVPFYMGVWNHPLLDLLPVNGMESITVFKSPQPQINGNNFASINLETKRARKEGSTGNLRLTTGSFSTLSEQADINGRYGNIDFSLAQGFAKSNGHRKNADGELKNIMGHLGVEFNQQWSASVNLLAVDNYASDPGDHRSSLPAEAPKYATKASLVSIALTHQHGDMHGDLKVYHNQGHGDWLRQAGMDGDTLTYFSMQGLRWKEEFKPWSGATLSFGIDHDSLKGEVQFNRLNPAPKANFNAPTFQLTSSFVGLHQALAIDQVWRVVPSLGIRFNQHNQFESVNTPTFGVSLVSDRASFFMQASRGINYAGLETTVLSSLITPLGSSWKNLQAENLDHLEVGSKFSIGNNTQIDVSLFKDKVNNRYVFGFPPDVPPPPQFLNLGSYHNQGAEIAIRTDVSSELSIFAGGTFLNPSIDYLPYTPKRAYTLGVNAQIAGLRLSMDVQSQSEVWALNRARAAGAINHEKVSGFTVANARIACPFPEFGKKTEMFIALENLFNRNYAYRPGYPMPGRSAQLGMSASF